jgi:hypothetical protein
LFLRCS